MNGSGRLAQQYDRLVEIDKERREREFRMMNALEILSEAGDDAWVECRPFCRFVRRTAREGLGRERR
jgi:hypothetical protein